MHKRILFSIDGLHCGGKERRLVELLHFLKAHTDYEMHLVLTVDHIHYKSVHDLDIPITIIKRRLVKKDPSFFFRFMNVVRKFKPDIIHTWGIMETFYAIPSSFFFNNYLVASLVSSAHPNFSKLSLTNFFFKISMLGANVVLGNSQVGLNGYKVNQKKGKLIYNGTRMERFTTIQDPCIVRNMLNVKTRFMVVMVASATTRKDYDMFLDLAKIVCAKRADVTFIGVGGGDCLSRLRNRIRQEAIPHTLLTGKRTDVESLIGASDIGLLLTHAEGISNSIMEYMALAKPVITTDIQAGSREIVKDTASGFIVEPNVQLVAKKLERLLDDNILRKRMGYNGKKIIQDRFTIQRMGKEFREIYADADL